MPSLELSHQLSRKDIENFVPHGQNQETKDEDFNYSKRGQWLRAAVLGATDGLVSVASLMMGVGAVKGEVKAMILAGFAGLVAGACSMAIGEFVSVYTQLDIEVAQMKRNKISNSTAENEEKTKDDDERLPNPFHAAVASAVAFAVGAVIPLLAAVFTKEYKVRLGIVIAVSSLTLVVFGAVGAALGRTPVARSCARVVAGGWMAMGITFGLTKLIGTTGI